ncbi:patatin-like protein [Dongia deserti]|uniref:patatin-like protein n=1 Tax=Dongia deserti TaxID=2268030 RepID=UPI000E65D556|nr:patatin-like protein [Dongia deserti]
MKQIEVRLAVVLYGGVSLAVYIHGVTREILNLVRASKQFRAGRGATPPAGDSTAIYHELFRKLSPELDLRVVVDLISGASAGGINGVMLAKALAHDLPLEPHRELWLKNADVTSLAAPGSPISRLTKAAMAPLFDQFLARRFGQQVADPETRAKLRQFVQAQWFTPPFSGERFSGWILDACDAMEQQASPNGTLLPPGHRLDLFVTLTDYRGHRHRIQLHDPPSVDETEHRRIVSFTCRRALSGEIVSEFTRDDVPSLVFAARATASFPGAFPPATIAEMDRILAGRSRDWPTRRDFITKKLAIDDPHGKANAGGYFIDGSVVMNKPFSPVIHALGNRPASREVVRRIIYVDPNPHREAVQRGDQGTPGFFRTILTAMALIPRNEPIADDLMAIQEWNERARRMAEILAAADPQVEKLVDEIVDADPENPPTIDEIGRYRSAANEKTHAGAGFAYLSYQTLKLRRVIERLSALIAALAKAGGAEADAAQVERLLDRMVAPNEDGGTARLVPFLRMFDLDFRVRRIRFVIRRLNELYRTMEQAGLRIESGAIDELKGALYEVMDRLTRRWDTPCHGPESAASAMHIAQAAAAYETPTLELFGALERSMGLIQIDRDLDEIISLMGLNYLPPMARRAVTMSYVGFAFYDLITFPILQWTDMDEINEVLVDRISPADAHGLGPEKIMLKGTALMSFGAFFNRTWREHDYLWGRLNAADRCVDVLISALGARLTQPIDADRLRADLFRAILDSEGLHLTADPGLIAGIRDKLARES